MMMIILLIIFTHYNTEDMELKFSIVHLGDVRFTHFLSLSFTYN